HRIVALLEVAVPHVVDDLALVDLVGAAASRPPDEPSAGDDVQHAEDRDEEAHGIGHQQRSSSVSGPSASPSSGICAADSKSARRRSLQAQTQRPTNSANSAA